MSIFVEPQQQQSATEQFIQAFAPQALNPLQQFSELMRKQGETAFQNRFDQEQMQNILSSIGEGQNQVTQGQGQGQVPQGNQVFDINKPLIKPYSDKKILAYLSSNNKTYQRQGEEMSKQNKEAEARYNADRKFALEQQKEQLEVERLRQSEFKASGLMHPEAASSLGDTLLDMSKDISDVGFRWGTINRSKEERRKSIESKGLELISFARQLDAKGQMPIKLFEKLEERIPLATDSERAFFGKMKGIAEILINKVPSKNKQELKEKLAPFLQSYSNFKKELNNQTPIQQIIQQPTQQPQQQLSQQQIIDNLLLQTNGNIDEAMKLYEQGNY